MPMPRTELHVVVYNLELLGLVVPVAMRTQDEHVQVAYFWFDVAFFEAKTPR